MFRCHTCGQTDKYIPMAKVILIVREVNYLLQVRYDKAYEKDFTVHSESKHKIVKRRKGYEIVKEGIFCPTCIPKKHEPKVMGSVERTQLIAVKKLKRADKESRGEKRHGRTRKDNKQAQ